jgi:4-amino-4-deoxy-L-arabinose transferase-like glycosyltransferase
MIPVSSAKKNWLWGILLVAILYFPVFLHLDTPPVRLWDESRLAMNAVEMYHNGFSLVTTFDGEPDMWNTKPPLMIWLQVICMKVFGIGELALRLPAALAGLATCLIMVLFSRNITGQYKWGYIGAIILVCSAGYTRFHVVRSGDYDALLVFFTTMACLSFYVWLERGCRNKYWWLFCLSLLLAVYTKGISGVIILPALLFWVVITGNFWKVIMRKQTWAGIVLVLLGIFAYYAGREALTPGYIQAVWDNELGGRYLQTLEGHGHDFWFYFDYMSEMEQFHPWWIFGILAIIGIWFYNHVEVKRWMLFCLLVAVVFFMIISLGKTKLEWYSAPIYPFLGLLSAFGLLALYDTIAQWDVSSAGFSKNWLPYAFVFLVLAVPYYNTVKWVYSPGYMEWEKGYYGMSEYFKYSLRKQNYIDGSFAVTEGYVPHISFYEYVFRQKGQSVIFADKDDLQSGNRVIADQEEVKSYIEHHYTHEVTDQYGSTNIYLIKGRE